MGEIKIAELDSNQMEFILVKMHKVAGRVPETSFITDLSGFLRANSNAREHSSGVKSLQCSKMVGYVFDLSQEGAKDKYLQMVDEARRGVLQGTDLLASMFERDRDYGISEKFAYIITTITGKEEIMDFYDGDGFKIKRTVPRDMRHEEIGFAIDTRMTPPNFYVVHNGDFSLEKVVTDEASEVAAGKFTNHLSTAAALAQMWMEKNGVQVMPKVVHIGTDVVSAQGPLSVVTSFIFDSEHKRYFHIPGQLEPAPKTTVDLR